MGKALYRKYRSKDLSEIIGQPQVVKTLENALAQGKIAHAYLLTGPRGTGKTSIARIIAHRVNDLPYSEDPHFDIIEIDAASNNGVEDVRALREKVQSAPTSARYKVYIIDEVHMLSKAAFNALLKTLEEPPAHVIFILATTDVGKVPETIISRTQRFILQPVELPTVVSHLRTIADKEGIAVTDEALALIAEHGEGSFRDSIGLLDQASTLGKKIEYEDIEALLGRAPRERIDALLTAVREHRPDQIITLLDEFYAAGFEADVIASQLGKLLRTALVSGEDGFSSHALLSLLRALIEVPASPHPRQLLELVLLEQTFGSADDSVTDHVVSPTPTSSSSHVASSVSGVAAATSASAEQLQKRNETPLPHQSKPLPLENGESKSTMTTTPEPTNDDDSLMDSAVPHGAIAPTGREDVDELWHAVLQDIKKSHNTLYGIARMAKPRFIDDVTLQLSLKFPFHQKRLAEARNSSVLVASVVSHRGKETRLDFIVAAGESDEKTEKVNIANISNIFGDAELLE